MSQEPSQITGNHLLAALPRDAYERLRPQSGTDPLLTQMSLCSACNRFHTLNARLARWLLMTQDRIGSDEFRLTQDFMSNMLGVRREGVNKVAGELQREKLISYNRGHMAILNRAGLKRILVRVLPDHQRGQRSLSG